MATCTQKPSLLCFDFDRTVTAWDTIRLLGITAAVHRGEAQQFSEESLPSSWMALEKIYLEERAAFFKNEFGAHSPDAPLRTFDADGIESFIGRLQVTEEQAVARGSEAKVLEGIQLSRLVEELPRQLAPLWAVRRHVGQVLQAAAVQGVQLGLISVNWCPEMIAGVLQSELPAALVPTGLWFQSEALEANQGVTTGRISVRVGGGLGKREALRRMRRELGDAAASVVYIGDSVTDILALLDADLGIVIEPDKGFLRTAAIYGIEVVPLEKATTMASGANKGLLWEVKGWDEIHKFFGW